MPPRVPPSMTPPPRTPASSSPASSSPSSSTPAAAPPSRPRDPRPPIRHESWLRRHPVLFFFGSLALLITTVGAAMVWWLWQDLPPVEELERYQPSLSTRLLDHQGRPVGQFFLEQREQVPLEEISPLMTGAIVAVEDRRFRSHWGVDLFRVGSALAVDLVRMSYVQGASTITQQLARNLYLSRQKSLLRKAREVLTAFQIERHYSKDEILEMYLTQAYFGHGAYGVQQAARRFFSVDAKELDASQSALLVSLLKAPRRYSPYHHPDRALERRNTVLGLMARHGVISREKCDAARALPVVVVGGETLSSGTAPYFCEEVRQQLEDLQEQLGVDIYRDGLEVHTTLDLDMQGLAEAACTRGAARLDSISRASFYRDDWLAWARKRWPARSEDELWSLRGDPKHLALVDSLLEVQTALVALEPASGAIRAMVGGRDFARSRFNRATQAVRQPGSAFKPFVYTAALDNGYAPSFRLSNGPIRVEDGTGKMWEPQNYDGAFGGPTPLRVALKESYNLVAVRLLMDVVPPEMVIQYARQMGITTPIAKDLSMALGSSGVLPIELVSAYACLANGGIHQEPFAIDEIRDRRGHVLWRHQAQSREALSAGTASLMTDMLQSVLADGTGAAARHRFGFTAPAAGKTGTTNAYTDAWFVGFTPRLACGVWLGHDDPAFSLGAGMAGGKAALPVWSEFMRDSYSKLAIPPDAFVRSPEVVELSVCSGSMELAGPFCPAPRRELYLKAYAPAGRCSQHRVD